MQPTVSELRAASDEAVAAAQAGLGPLFASHLQTQLLERPQDFVNDQVPLVSAAGRARLALLDAEAAETDAATTPAALKRLLDREVSKVLGAQEQFEARVDEKLGELRTRVEKGEEAVHELVTVKGAELRTELTQLAAQQHEKSATELVEKMGAFRGEFQVAMMSAQAEIEKLRAQVAQLELRVLPGTGLVVDHKPLFAKLGYGAETTVDAFKSDLVKKTELNYAGKGLDADDTRALAGILGSFGKSVDFRKIDLTGNTIGNVGMTAIAEVIRSGAFDGLEVLKIANCGFGYKGFHSFTEIWIAYRTFRLVELTLGGIKVNGHFDLHDCLTEINAIAEAGLAARMARLQLNDAVLDMRGRTFGSGQNSAAGVPVVSGAETIHQAHSLSTLHIVMVMEAKQASTGTAYGSNPYQSGDQYPNPSSIRTCFLHLTGRDSGLVLIESVANMATEGSTANGVTTQAMHLLNCGACYRLTSLGSSTFA